MNLRILNGMKIKKESLKNTFNKKELRNIMHCYTAGVG